MLLHLYDFGHSLLAVFEVFQFSLSIAQPDILGIPFMDWILGLFFGFLMLNTLLFVSFLISILFALLARLNWLLD